MDFLTYLKTNAEEIDNELNNYFSKWREKVEEVSPKLLNLIDASIEANQGGKRLRGVLVKLGYELAKPSAISHQPSAQDKEIYKVGVAYEIFQTAILAHDDIIDKSPTRRGKPTLFKQLGGDHHAISQTICLGDIGFFLSINVIAETKFPDDLKNKALQQFTKTMTETAFGEMLDIELPYLKTAQSEAEILTIARYKTAWYTIVGPMQLGAILAGANQQLLDKIKIYGENLGIAFQIQDDILGIFGDEKTLGKSVTSDVEEGKLTLLYLKSLEQGSEEQKEYLAKNYGQGSISNPSTSSGQASQLATIKEIFTETGALAYANSRAGEYVTEAKKTITDLTDNTDLQSLLTEISDFLIKRSK